MIIRTPDQRLRVFVSSTLGELADERRAVARSISALRLTPVMFELGARPHPPQDLYRAYLAQSDFRTAAELGRLVRDDLATLLSERFAAGSALAAEPAVAPSRPAAQHPPPPALRRSVRLGGRDHGRAGRARVIVTGNPRKSGGDRS